MWFQMSLSSHQPATRSTGEMSEMCANTGTGGRQQLQRHRESLFMCLSIELGTNSAATCNTRFYSFSCVAILEGIGWQGSKCVTMKRVH